MSRVFVSYRHVDPDQRLAEHLVERLGNSSHEVFWDNLIPLGQNWAEIIDRQLRTSEVFVVLISEESMRSDMVCEEIRMAHRLSRASTSPLRICRYE
jgi:hypothetical protein